MQLTNKPIDFIMTVGAECSVSPRQDCFPTGSEIDRIQCRSKGCHWCPGDPTMFRDEPWCVTGKYLHIHI